MWWRSAHLVLQTSAPQMKRPVGLKANPPPQKRTRRWVSPIYQFLGGLGIDVLTSDKLIGTSCLPVQLVNNMMGFFVCHLSQVCLRWVQSCQSWSCIPAVYPLKALSKLPKTQQLKCPLSLKVKLSGTLRTQVWYEFVTTITQLHRETGKICLSSAYHRTDRINCSSLILIFPFQGYILCVTTVTSSAGSTPQDSASSPPTTTLRRCGMQVVRLVSSYFISYLILKRSKQANQENSIRNTPS